MIFFNFCPFSKQDDKEYNHIPADEKITVKVSKFDTTTIDITMCENDTIKQLTTKIFKIDNTFGQDNVIIALKKFTPLEKHRTLKYYNIQNGDKLYVVVNMPDD